MARYDRIAPLGAPPRERVFPAWLALRDLEGCERDADLARRARLRFLALRPVRRLLRQGIDGVPVESFERQVEGIREELGHLSARDPERAQLAKYLHRIRQRTPLALVTATLDMGEMAESAGHYWAAQEFYLTGLELAEVHGLVPEQIIALRLLGRICRNSTCWDRAEEYYRRALRLAEDLGERRQWARAMDGMAAVHRFRADPDGARRLLEEARARGREWEDPHVVAIATAGLCVHELALDEPERAVEYGWEAVRSLERGDERANVLANLAVAFERLGMYLAAERCYAAVVSETTSLARSMHARAAHAVMAALTGEANTFRARRRAILAESAGWDGEPSIAAQVHLELGRGCLLVGDVDFARDHLRETIAIAKRHGFTELLLRAEEQLAQHESAATAAAARPSHERPGEVARRIAAQVAAADAALIPAGV